MVRDPITMQIKSMFLLCEVCNTYTKHVLDKSAKHLVCRCGEQQAYLNSKTTETKGQRQ